MGMIDSTMKKKNDIVLFDSCFNRTEQKMNLYVYSNYQKIRITDIPLLSSIVWDVTDTDYDTLIHPEKI